jgi:eukaryotic-like serine/threonine-protein kinase
MAAEKVVSISQKCPVCGASIDTTDAEPLARIACPKCGEKVRVERSFNNFVLLETLGVGGMGTVYKARDTLLDRLVALKLLRRDLGTEIDPASRLQQEARVAASINHPNVIQVFSSGTDHGQFYLVMELVDHGSLDDFIEDQKHLPEEQVLEAGIQVAKGLRAAYAKGLIHRDVKPANILFTDEHMAKIGDFGLAGAAAENAETRGEIWGTPYYVAPERLKNEPEDFRSDIYSLGATLFHAIAGKAPIEGETNSAAALRDLKEKPLDLRQIAPQVSAATVSALHRMIAPDPANRFASYDDLVAELERARDILIGKESGEGANWRRKRQLFVIGAVLAVALALAGFFAYKMRAPEAGAPIAPRAPVIPLSELERQFHDARHKLVTGKHRVAHAAFARIALDARNRQPLYDWLRLSEGLAAMVGREQSQARQAFQDVENAGTRRFAKPDLDLAGFLLATARKAAAPDAVPAASVERGADFKSFALLLFAIKDVSQTDIEDATALLDEFVNTQPQGKFAWIGDYKPLAQKYLNDCRVYTSWKNAPENANPAEALEKLKAIRKQLKTHSAISDEIIAAEKTVARGSVRQQKAESAAREEEQKREAKEAPRKKAEWLAEWKRKLIDDLNHRHYVGEIADVHGVKYTGITSANSERLALKTPYGTVELPWNRLSAKTLLAISTAFIQPNAPGTADRQWLCAIFAGETGQNEEAKKLAEEAAKSKPEYHEQIPFFFPH